MIAFKDFKKKSKMLGFVAGPLESAVEEANRWIASERVDVINVETLSDTGGIGGMSSTSQDGIRIWYHQAETA